MPTKYGFPSYESPEDKAKRLEAKLEPIQKQIDGVVSDILADYWTSLRGPSPYRISRSSYPATRDWHISYEQETKRPFEDIDLMWICLVCDENGNPCLELRWAYRHYPKVDGNLLNLGKILHTETGLNVEMIYRLSYNDREVIRSFQ